MAQATLEQWRMFEAVVRHGGFAQAAAAVHKSQSSINHAVHKLQHQLGLELLEVKGRKAELTEAGHTMLRRAQQLLAQAQQIEDAANCLVKGEEAELRVAVDETYPTTCLANAFQRFGEDYPSTRIQLFETILSGGPEKLATGEVDLLISASVPEGLVGEPLLQVEFVALAHPDHPLHQIGRTVFLDDLAQHRQIVVRDSTRGKRTDSGWLGAEQRWTVSHLASSIDMVCSGTGFAWLPMSRAASAVQRGLLRELPLERGARRVTTLYLTHANQDRIGPAARHLASILEQESCHAEGL